MEAGTKLNCVRSGTYIGGVIHRGGDVVRWFGGIINEAIFPVLLREGRKLQDAQPRAEDTDSILRCKNNGKTALHTVPQFLLAEGGGVAFCSGGVCTACNYIPDGLQQSWLAHGVREALRRIYGEEGISWMRGVGWTLDCGFLEVPDICIQIFLRVNCGTGSSCEQWKGIMVACRGQRLHGHRALDGWCLWKG